MTIPDKKKIPIVFTMAVKRKMVDSAHIDVALDIQNSQLEKGVYHALEDILCDNKFVSPGLRDQIAGALLKFEKRFCEMVVQKGVALQEDVDYALWLKANRKGGRLYDVAHILIHSGAATRSQCYDIMSIQEEEAWAAMKKKNHKPVKKAVSAETVAAVNPNEVLPAEPATEVSPSEALPDEPLPVASQSEDTLPEEVVKAPDDMQPPMGSEESLPEDILRDGDVGGGLQLAFTDEGLEAWLYMAKDLTEPPKLEEVKELLKNHGVIVGVVDDFEIMEKVQNRDSENSKFRVAMGKLPVTSKNALVNYHYDTEYLNAGIILDDGSIDFKDRGKLPFAKAGDLLAEKQLAVIGEDGVDVFGNPILVADAQDTSLKAGAGTELKDNDLKLYASVSGRPDLSMDGTVSVFNELVIKGDVDYKTGHIDFDGNILVKGVVKNGFKVRGANLVVDEIAGGDITITGDLCVSRGILDSTIRSKGTVIAKHISKSDIRAFGDIMVQKEIIESNIVASGVCNAAKGKIIASNIAASQGVEAGQIGTPMSSPCSLKIGSAVHLNSEIDKIDLKIQPKEKMLQESLDKLQALKIDLENNQKKLNENAHIQDRSMIKLRELNDEKEALGDNKDDVSVINSHIEILEEELVALEKAVGENFDREDLLSAEQSHEVGNQESIKASIGLLNEKKTLLNKWGSENKLKAVVKRCKLICARTSIAGANTAIILRDDLKNAEIREVKTEEVGWEMKVS